MAQWHEEIAKRVLRELSDAHKAYGAMIPRAANLSAGEKPVPWRPNWDALNKSKARLDAADKAFRDFMSDPRWDK